MVEVVRALNELRFLRLDGQLNFHNYLISIQQIHEDVLVSFVESVLDPDDLHVGIWKPVPPFDLFIESNDFAFS